MASETIGAVRADLIADPTGFKRGVEDASGSLARIAAIGSTVGNVLAQAFIRVGERFAELAGELGEGKGDVWDKLSDNGQRAVSAIVQSFNSMKEASAEAAAQLIERVGPAFAQLIQFVSELNVNTALLQAVFEGVVAAIKAVVTVGITAVATVSDLFNSLQALGSMAARLAQTLGEVVSNALSPSKAAEAWRQGMADIGRISEDVNRRNEAIWKDAHTRIANIWSNSPIRAEKIKPEIEGIEAYMKKLQAEAVRVFEATRTPAERLQLEIDKLNANPFIKGETLSRAIEMVQEKYSGLRKVLQDIGRNMASAFADAIVEGKKFSEVLQTLLKDIARILLNKVFTDILLGSSMSKPQGVTGGLLGSLFGSMQGFAQGGSFKVGGTGGTDSQMVAFRATPGERVVIGHDAAGSGGGGQPRVTINNYANAEVSADRTSEDDLLVTVRGIVQDELGSGRSNAVMGGKFGLRPRVRNR
jgi:hypothetical protein